MCPKLEKCVEKLEKCVQKLDKCIQKRARINPGYTLIHNIGLQDLQATLETDMKIIKK